MQNCPLCGGTITNPELTIDTNSFTIASAAGVARFTPDEYTIFDELYTKRPRTVRLPYLIDCLMADRPNEEPPMEGVVRTHITRINKKIAPFNLRITSHWGVGYFMELTG